MMFNFTPLLNKEFFNKCLLRNVKGKIIMDNFSHIELDMEKNNPFKSKKKKTKIKSKKLYKLVDKANLKNRRNERISLLLKRTKKTNVFETPVQTLLGSTNVYANLMHPVRKGFKLKSPCGEFFLPHYLIARFFKSFILTLQKRKDLSLNVLLAKAHEHQDFVILSIPLVIHAYILCHTYLKNLRKKKPDINIIYTFLPLSFKKYESPKKKEKQSNRTFKTKKKGFGFRSGSVE